MIPYDELVAALASWRQRQGLQAGPSDYLGEPAQPRYDDDYAASAGASGGYGEDVVELSDDMMDSVMEEQSNPYSVEAVETVDDGGAQYETDTQDQDYESAMPVEPPKPEPEPTGKRKRKR